MMEKVIGSVSRAAESLNSEFFLMFESKETGVRRYAGDEVLVRRFLRSGLRHRRSDVEMALRQQIATRPSLDPLAVYEDSPDAAIPNSARDSAPAVVPLQEFKPDVGFSIGDAEEDVATPFSQTSNAQQSRNADFNATSLGPDDVDYWLSSVSNGRSRPSSFSCRPVLTNRRRPVSFDNDKDSGLSSVDYNQYDGWLSTESIQYSKRERRREIDGWLSTESLGYSEREKRGEIEVRESVIPAGFWKSNDSPGETNTMSVTPRNELASNDRSGDPACRMSRHSVERSSTQSCDSRGLQPCSVSLKRLSVRSTLERVAEFDEAAADDADFTAMLLDESDVCDEADVTIVSRSKEARGESHPPAKKNKSKPKRSSAVIEKPKSSSSVIQNSKTSSVANEPKSSSSMVLVLDESDVCKEADITIVSGSKEESDESHPPAKKKKSKPKCFSDIVVEKPKSSSSVIQKPKTSSMANEPKSSSSTVEKPKSSSSVDDYVETTKTVKIKLPWGEEVFKLWFRKKEAKLTAKMYYIRFLEEFYAFKWFDRYLSACKFGCTGPIGFLKLHKRISLHFSVYHKKVPYGNGTKRGNSLATATKWRQLLGEALCRSPPSSTVRRNEAERAPIYPRGTMELPCGTVDFDLFRRERVLFLRFFKDSRDHAYQHVYKSKHKPIIRVGNYAACPLGCVSYRECHGLFQLGSLSEHFRTIHRGKQLDHLESRARTQKKWQDIYEEEKAQYA